ncbi:MAG: primosomal protein N', partial [Rhodocyclaceae bacterium]
MRLIQVALDLPVPHPFDYCLDGASGGDPIGRLVRVPFGSSGKIGIVVGEIAHSARPAEKLKAAELIETSPTLPKEWLELCRFCAQYYHHPLGQVTAFALPPLLRKGKKPRAPKPKLGAAAANGGGGAAGGGGEAPASGAGTASLTGNVPTPDQQAAIDAITAARGFQTFLLFGVTGSGKTEVYLSAIESVLAKGGQALMLVPEIALTPQLEARVRERFPGARIVSAHSGVGDAARAHAFLAALEGHADIVLGTRLAVFMPMPRLGLIVVDEEHDPSFKQQEGLRYSARDVAIWRARQCGIPVVLGSATPSLESFHHAVSGRYALLELPERAVTAAELPTVVTVDTRKQKLQDGLSQELIAAVSERLQRGEQSLVFLNRRGYAPVLACPACGWISRCRRCAANLVLHLADRRLRCHHCGLEAMIPR